MGTRHLARDGAEKWCEKYKDRDADILLDVQFYQPKFVNNFMESFGLEDFRKSVSALGALGDNLTGQLTRKLVELNKELRTSAVLAPAIIFEPDNQKIIAINEQLFAAARQAGNELGIPTHACIPLSSALRKSPSATTKILSAVTSFDADGWNLAIEYGGENRIPIESDWAEHVISSALYLVATDLPVIQAFAGPSALLSLSAGANAAAVGHFKNFWNFSRSIFEVVDSEMRKPKAQRYFSAALWSTILAPDEIARLEDKTWNGIRSDSPFGPNYKTDAIDERTAHNHLIHTLANEAPRIANDNSIRKNLVKAQNFLLDASYRYEIVLNELGSVADTANVHQKNWADGINNFLKTNSDRVEYVDLLRS